MNKSETTKKLRSSVAAIIVLAVCLCITTFALLYPNVTVDNNLFQTGTIAINLNDSKPVIEEEEFLFEPGMTVEKKFFLENQGTWDVYYKLYLDNIEGGLADVLNVTIRDDDKTLYTGKAAELTRENVGAADDILKQKERRELAITFYYPKEAGNRGQSQYLSFDLKANAVQTKNNPQRLFE